MNKEIAILLNGPIKNDARVIKTIKTFALGNNIDLFYTKGNNIDIKLFKNYNNVNLYNINYPNSLYQKVIRHTIFYKEFDFFVNDIKKLKKNYDVVYCNDLPTLRVGIILKKIFVAKLIYDSHEIYIETINQFFLKSKNPFKNIIFKLLIAFMRFVGTRFEKKALKSVDEFITVNESLANYFSKKYNLKKHVFVIMNFPYLFNNKDSAINLKREFNWSDDDVVLIYQGNLNYGRGLNLIINTIEQLHKKYKLVIIGSGVLMKNLQKQVIDKKLASRVVFKGMIENSELLKYTAKADVGFNLLEAVNKSKAMASPNKLFEYIQAEVPSINTNTIENKKIIDKYKIGLLSENSIESIKQALIDIKSNYNTYKENCKNAKHDLDWKNQEAELLNILNDK